MLQNNQTTKLSWNMQINNPHVETAFCISSKIAALCTILGRQNDLVDEIFMLNELLTAVTLDLDNEERFYDLNSLSRIMMGLDLDKINERILKIASWRKNGQKL